MQLHLKANRQVVCQYPLGDLRRVKCAVDWRNQHRATFGKTVLGEDGTRPFVVTAVGEYEFHFVVRRKMLNVGPQVLATFARAGGFQVDDAGNPRVDRRDIVGALGF